MRHFRDTPYIILKCEKMSAPRSKCPGENKTFKAVQFLLSTKEAARRPSNFDVRDLEYSDKLRNISVSGDLDDIYKVNLKVLLKHLDFDSLSES